MTAHVRATCSGACCFGRLALAALLVLGSTLGAQTGGSNPDADWITMQRGSDSLPMPDGGRVVVFARRPGVHSIEGGTLWLRLRVDNDTGKEHRVDIRVGLGDAGELRRTAGIPAASSRDFWLPLPGFETSIEAEVTIDGSRQIRMTPMWNGIAELPSRTLLPIGLGWRRIGNDWSDRRPDVSSVTIQRANPIEPGDLPPVWWMMSGFDEIWVDGSDGGVDADLQQRLCDFLTAGGLVFVRQSAQLPTGPLRELCTTVPAERDDGQVRRRVGFGMLLASRDGLHGSEIQRVREESERRSGSRVNRFALVVPDAVGRTLSIPGIGDVPARAFFLILLIFAILAGPVNYYVLRRRRQLSRLLVTVPVYGAATTLLILAIGIFSDGLGRRTVRRTVTILDQVSHRAVTLSQSTVFSGFSPGAAKPHPRSMVLPMDLMNATAAEQAGYGFVSASGRFVDARNWATESRLEQEPDGSIGGGIVPARTLSNLVAVTPRTDRNRIRLRREGESLRVLPSESIRPVDATETMLFRDQEGRLYANVADPLRLDPVTSAKASSLLALIRRSLDRLPTSRSEAAPIGSSGVARSSSRPSREFSEVFQSFPDEVGELLMPPRSGYVCLTSSPLFVEDFGWDAEVEREVHLLVATIGAEDIDG